MALINSTPQVQVSTIWSGLRHLTAGQSLVRVSSKRNGTREIPSSSVGSNSNPMHKNSVPACALLLNEFEFNPITVSILGPKSRTTLKPHWRVSHKSEDSFHKNIQGNDEFQVQEVCSAVFGSHHVRLSPSLVNNLMYQQIRGFKTRRSDATGISGARKLVKIETAKIPASNATFDAELFNQAMPHSEPEQRTGLAKFLSNLTMEEEVNVKISFADGYQAGSNWQAIGTGLRKTEANPLRVQAFFEGYKCYSTGNMPRDAVKPAIWTKVASAFVRNLIMVSLMIAIFVLLSPNISIKKVSFLSGEQFEINPETVTVKFDDVRGSAEAKAELANIVDFLKNPDKYTDLGAKLPNGCLLVGPPGVGKTLLAKAVAGEAGVPFFQASGAEFDEVYVGTGAKRVRQLFQAAKAKAPCVIFIDEIDSVGSKRTSSEIHPYANQTINQLLTEMDGFQPNEGVIVLGATNKKENLDKALLRPGRFDVEVPIKVPDLSERIEILNLYLPKLVTDQKVDVITVAKLTIGCTGADLNNICNHAAIKAATVGSPVVTMKHVEFAIDKVRMGPQKKRLQSEVVNRCTAYHESGHAIIQYYSRMNHAKTLHKITILPRGHALGMTHFISNESRQFQYTREEMLDDMDCLMGGRVAEELTFGDDKVSTGASSDMHRATRIAKNMVTTYGFSEKIGLRVHTTNNDTISERVKDEMDQEIKTILKEAYDRARKVLVSKQKQMGWLAEALLEYEELTYEEAKTIIEGGKLTRAATSPAPSPPAKSGPSGKDNTQPKPATISSNPIKPVKL